MADLAPQKDEGPLEPVNNVENERQSWTTITPGHFDLVSALNPLSITERVSKFVVSIKYTDLERHTIEKLKELLLDYVGVASAAAVEAESSPHIFSAVLALVGRNTGNASVVTKERQLPAPYAALLNAAYGHSFDFDDTHAAGILHPGVSVISAALAQAETSFLLASGSDLLTAMAVGYELTCRLGMALGTGGYPRGFHNTGTAGIFGAVAAICSLRQVERKVVENAFGLALSKAAGSMQYLENGSWNKRLHPGFAAHDAFMCVALAEAGVIGAAKPFEGQYGLVHAYSESGDVTPLLDGWGSKWEFEATALKPFPGCRMTHSQISLATKLSSAYGTEHGMPAQIVISLPKACMGLVGVPTPNKRHPITVVDAQFSSYFQTAAAWLYGSGLGWKVYEMMDDTAIWEMSDCITCKIDEKYSGFASNLRVIFEDGFEVEEELLFPLGESENPLRTSDVRVKADGLMMPIYGKEKSATISATILNIEECDVGELMRLLRDSA